MCTVLKLTYAFWTIFFKRYSEKNVSYILVTLNYKKKASWQISPLSLYILLRNKRWYWLEVLPRVCSVAPFAGVEWYCIIACNTGQSGIHFSALKELLSLYRSHHRRSWWGDIEVSVTEMRPQFFMGHFWCSSGRCICLCAAAEIVGTHCKALV